MRKIGEILVGARAITEQVRDETLAYMKTHRVSFGTALLEMGAIAEDALLRALSVQTGAPPVSSRDLAAVPPDLIRLVPHKLAEKHTAFPFRKVGRTLYIAMAHPKNNSGVDEIAFLTGLSVVRHVAITARVAVALEKYYGIPASPSHKALVAKLDGSAATGQPAASRGPGTEPAGNPVVAKLPSGIFRIPLSDGPADPWKLSSEPAPRTAKDEASISALARRLDRAEGTDEVGIAVLESLREKLDTVALFLVQGDRVTGWMVRPEPAIASEKLSVLFSDPSFFTALRSTTGFFAGPCPDTVANRRILESIGLRYPAVIGVVPVTMRGKTVLFLLGEAVGGSLSLQMPVLRYHASMTALAIEILALRKKLAAL